MGKSTTSVAALNAITAAQFSELSALGLADAKAERGQGEKRGALITWCITHGVNTASHSGSGAKRSLSTEQVKLFKTDTLIHRLSDEAQALYLMGGKQAAGRVALDTDGSTYTEKVSPKIPVLRPEVERGSERNSERDRRSQSESGADSGGWQRHS